MAGVPVACTSQPEFLRLGQEFGHLVHYRGDDPHDLKAALRTTMDTLGPLRERAAQAAGGLSWEREAMRLRAIYGG